jgi:hypothetical protein
MAFLLTHFWPGGTEDKYRTMIATVHPDGGKGLPKGQTYHVAGPTDGGYLISTVWDSKESADLFVKDVLLASLPVEGGFEGAPDEHSAEVSNLQTQ